MFQRLFLFVLSFNLKKNNQMKKVTFYASLLAIAVFSSSCKKEEPTDQRQKFVGVYVGSSNIIVPSLSMNTTKYGNDTVSLDPNSINKIRFGAKSDALMSSVNENTLIFDDGESSTFSTVNGIVFAQTTNTTGVLNGTNLTYNGVITYIIKGKSYTGTFTVNEVKQ
jgi:hypothetical protein